MLKSTLVGLFALFACAAADGQNNSLISITTGAADSAAAASARGLNRRAPRATTAGNRITFQPRTAPAPSLPAVPPPGFYPGDVSNPAPQGPTVISAESNNIYVNCHSQNPSSCWGDPSQFLDDLGESTFIHVIDQYTGVQGNNRYTVGAAAKVSYPVSGPLYDQDIASILHAAAKKIGTGYGHVYHVFLAPGIDVCFAGVTPPECYSPDNPANFIFCAYHGYVDFTDIGHVLYSVEPYQNVAGCQVYQPSVNGPLVDSTDDSLGHELFEIITDPDLDAWLNYYSLALYGDEIGDECEQAMFLNPVVSLDWHPYQIQPEYSNKYHACSYVP